MKKSRRRFLKTSLLSFLATFANPVRKAWGVIPFAFWRSQRGTAQVTQLVLKAAAQGGTANIRTTQVVAKIAAVGGGYNLRTTQTVAKVAVIGGAYSLRTTQVVVKVAVVP